jgi:acyl carrier protein
MNKQKVIIALKEIVTPYTENTEALEQLTEETDFIKDLQINSANLVDVVLDVEEKFDIEIDNDSMAKMLTVKAAIEIIEEKMAGVDRK